MIHEMCVHCRAFDTVPPNKPCISCGYDDGAIDITECPFCMTVNPSIVEGECQSCGREI